VSNITFPFPRGAPTPPSTFGQPTALSVASVPTLSGLSSAALISGQQVYITPGYPRSIWYLDKTQTVTPDNITTVATDTGVGTWFRLPWVDPANLLVTYGPINAITGSDYNEGTVAAPLRTADELARRLDAPPSGATSGRPTGVSIGAMYFDTSLHIPIWWNGTVWVNASGGTV
jgi:hypothetical protein